MRSRLPLRLGALSLLVAATVHAAPPDYQLQKLAFENEAAPVGGTFSLIFGESSIDDDGRVVASANADDGFTTLQLQLLWNDSSLGVALVEGDPLPTPPGGVVLAPWRGRVAAPDLYAFTAAYAGPGSTRGAFLRDGLIDTALLLAGDPAPGGGTLTRIDYVHDVNESGFASLGGLVDPGDGSSVPAHFAGSPGALSEVYRDGGTTPVGGVWSGVQAFHKTSVQADGSVAFGAAVAGGSASGGLFRWQTGSVSPLLLAGAAVPDASGDQFDAFASWVGSNEAGDLAFNASVLRSGAAFPTEAIYTLSGTQVEAVIHHGDVIPGTNPALSFQGLLGSTPPDISAAGAVVYTAMLSDPLDVSVPSLLLTQDGTTKIIALGGDPVPGVPGAVFTDFSNARINSSGQIAVTAGTDQGAGVFLASPVIPIVPALRGMQPVLVLALLALTGIRALDSPTRRRTRMPAGR